jgi:uncharacterized protein (TIGR00251 family)
VTKNSYFRIDAGGLVLTIRASPKASRNALLGVMETPEGPALKVAVTAPPDKGKANAALIDLMAKTFGVSKSSITLVAGETDRRKILRIGGNADELKTIAQRWMGS